MSAVYDWRAEGDFDDERAPHPDAVRLALCQVAEGRLPTLGTLKRALGISALRALAVRDHLAHLLADRDLAGRSSGTARAPRAGAGGEDATAGATAPDAAVPAQTTPGVPAPDPACERALDVFAADLAEGAYAVPARDHAASARRLAAGEADPRVPRRPRAACRLIGGGRSGEAVNMRPRRVRARGSPHLTCVHSQVT